MQREIRQAYAKQKGRGDNMLNLQQAKSPSKSPNKRYYFVFERGEGGGGEEGSVSCSFCYVIISLDKMLFLSHLR